MKKPNSNSKMAKLENKSIRIGSSESKLVEGSKYHDVLTFSRGDSGPGAARGKIATQETLWIAVRVLVALVLRALDLAPRETQQIFKEPHAATVSHHFLKGLQSRNLSLVAILRLRSKDLNPRAVFPTILHPMKALMIQVLGLFDPSSELKLIEEVAADSFLNGVDEDVKTNALALIIAKEPTWINGMIEMNGIDLLKMPINDWSKCRSQTVKLPYEITVDIAESRAIIESRTKYLPDLEEGLITKDEEEKIKQQAKHLKEWSLFTPQDSNPQFVIPKTQNLPTRRLQSSPGHTSRNMAMRNLNNLPLTTKIPMEPMTKSYDKPFHGQP